MADAPKGIPMLRRGPGPGASAARPALAPSNAPSAPRAVEPVQIQQPTRDEMAAHHAAIEAAAKKGEAYREQVSELTLAQMEANVDLMRGQTLASLGAALSALGEPRDDTAQLRLRILAQMDETIGLLEPGDAPDGEDEEAEDEDGADATPSREAPRSGPGG